DRACTMLASMASRAETLSTPRDDHDSAALSLPHPLVFAIISWTVVLLLGCVQLLAHRNRLSSADLVSYLDVANAYRRLRWQSALNGYWSPLYSWLLAAGVALVRPRATQEFTTVRLINLSIYLCAYGSFRFLLTRLIRAHETDVARRGN